LLGDDGWLHPQQENLSPGALLKVPHGYFERCTMTPADERLKHLRLKDSHPSRLGPHIHDIGD
jgi:hypothetical protein